MLRKPILTAIAASLLWSAGVAARAAERPRPFVHPLFSDHAVLQRDVPLPVWGWTEAGKTVHVSIGGKTAEATAGADGRWQATIGPLAAGGPYTLEVSGPQKVTVNDVLFGQRLDTVPGNRTWRWASATATPRRTSTRPTSLNSGCSPCRSWWPRSLCRRRPWLGCHRARRMS